MFGYIKLLFQGMFSKDFWSGRWETFLSLIRKPGDFYAKAGQKDWDRDAYLLGISFSFLEVVLFSLLFSGFVGLFSGLGGLMILLWSLIYGLVGWFIGIFVTYYGVAWLFGWALKLVTKKDQTEKIRPILFTLSPSYLLCVVPGLGSLLTLAAAIVLLVIAYEKALKVERGPAIGSSLLGMVFTGVAASVFGAVLGVVLFSGAGFSLLSLSSHGWMHSSAGNIPANTTLGINSSPMTDAQKLNEAAPIVRHLILDELESNFGNQSLANLQAISARHQEDMGKLDDLYGSMGEIPIDAYRQGIQQVVDQDQPTLKQKYPTTFNESKFWEVLSGYYDYGKGPANVKVASVEQWRINKAQASSQTQPALQPTTVPAAVSAQAPHKKKVKKTSVPPSVQVSQGDTTTAPAVENAAPSTQAAAPAPTPTHADVVGKAVGDAVGDAAKKALGF